MIHSQPPLRVTAALAAPADGDKITLPRLQRVASMTAGNLATQLCKLEDVGYIAITKSYRRRTPVTCVTLTRTGGAGGLQRGAPRPARRAGRPAQNASHPAKEETSS